MLLRRQSYRPDDTPTGASRATEVESRVSGGAAGPAREQQGVPWAAAPRNRVASCCKRYNTLQMAAK
eukprot:11778333-Alexandrium_andersonii.AAC.1